MSVTEFGNQGLDYGGLAAVKVFEKKLNAVKGTTATTTTCLYQKLGWPTLSEISCTQLLDVPDQTSSGRASFHKNPTSHSKRAHGRSAFSRERLEVVFDQAALRL